MGADFDYDWPTNHGGSSTKKMDIDLVLWLEVTNETVSSGTYTSTYPPNQGVWRTYGMNMAWDE
ncbi:hypothetical protein QW180_17445 [Vibrio sinaloensis]|nr:hypothetical protein [Vibrio sinaloensis]